MQAINQKVGKVRCFGEIYNSPAEMLSTINRRAQIHGSEDSLNYYDDSKWSGYRSGSKFQDDFLASNVDAKIIRQVETGIKGIPTQAKKRVVFENSVAGFQPIVPLALMGVPESMRTSRRVEKRSKIVDVVIDCTASASTSAKKMAEASIKMAGTVAGLEKQGFRVNLMAGFFSCKRSQCDFVCVKMKDAGQPLNIARMMFPFTTAAFVRRAGFAWYERTDGIEYTPGYGIAIGYEDAEYRSAVKSVFGAQTVLMAASDVVQGMDIDKAIREAIA